MGCLQDAVEKLHRDFDTIVWQYSPEEAAAPIRTQLWPGSPAEDVMLCVYKGRSIQEPFHRQDYFFFNFAYQGDYGALSARFDHRITVRENECYIGQPYAGYAINGQSETDIIIVGVLIQKQAFFKTFLHVLSASSELFRFFLTPQMNRHSDEFIHLRFEEPFSVRSLLELMILEYAQPREDTQEILRSLTLALLMQVARQYRLSNLSTTSNRLTDKVVQYIGEHFDTATLQGTAEHFSYHPNYLSTLLSQELGKTFSEILLEQRMERAVALLCGTTLPISEIAALLGYSNASNFYKAFRKQYHLSPREYLQRQQADL